MSYDVIIIGGGATGLGVAVEAATRGYSTILFEANDFGSGTSSKSTKLVHGGIRYLENFDFALVKEGLNERATFLNSAPHIAKVQGYLVPFYGLWDKLKYFLGIKLYDFLASGKKLGSSVFLNKKQALKLAPELNPQSLRGGAVYYDGQFDDTRMLITLLRTFLQHGGQAFNYHEITGLIKNDALKVIGVRVHDKLNNNFFDIQGKVIINATGVMTDSILDLDQPETPHKNVTAARGSHIVLDKKFFDSPHALVIPKTIDDRILFVLPWHDKIVVGTTDIMVDQPCLEPDASDLEIDFILDTLNKYTRSPVKKTDILSVFSGLRPLVKPAHKTNSAKISRKHEILYSISGIISIVGGKWTIYRLMGEDTINFAISKSLLPPSKSISQNLHLFGYTKDKIAYPLNVYGSDVTVLKEIQKEMSNQDKLHPELPYYAAEVIYQVRFEMAKTVEDVLARRTRALFLNARYAMEAAITVARLMAKEMGKNEYWVEQQVEQFHAYAAKYVVVSENK
ncbi:MAG: glycerol-3-phosphate dehydrogenase [Burkholderiales bacterium]|jgi:glycerol-3-phosphate dehydrogenase|nr:glycerol-3-phosphate dehydrogenase [Burkholderiales bacterium]